jgi:TrmH family RNA methyltransferase
MTLLVIRDFLKSRYNFKQKTFIILEIMKNWKDNVYFVLVEPKEAGNIGASARAIKNMGFRNLHLVNPASFITDESLWFAHGAADILESARVFATVRDAVGDISIVAGTSRRTGRKRGIFLHAEQGAKRLFDGAHANKIAILFGREDRGLFNEEIKECGFLITIPADKRQPSLNLAQSVLIIAYELSKAGYQADFSSSLSGVTLPRLVNNEELVPLFDRIDNALTMFESYKDKNLRKKIVRNLKRCIGRAGLTYWEIKMFHGLCSEIMKTKK